MAYRIIVDRRPVAVYDRPEPALAYVRAVMRAAVNTEPEVLDSRTGRAFEVAASVRWRDELAGKIGY